MKERILELWCSLTHGGGEIKRDHIDRINWQCSKCERWADAIPVAEESRLTEAAIANKCRKYRACERSADSYCGRCHEGSYP